MIKTITPKAPSASVEQTHALGNLYLAGHYTPEQAMAHLKSVNYIVEGTHYKATYIANYLAGAYRIVSMVREGRATCTKAKGLSLK